MLQMWTECGRGHQFTRIRPSSGKLANECAKVWWYTAVSSARACALLGDSGWSLQNLLYRTSDVIDSNIFRSSFDRASPESTPSSQHFELESTFELIIVHILGKDTEMRFQT